MSFPNILTYRSSKPANPFLVEYAKRNVPFTMSHNHYHDYYEVYVLLSGERIYFIKDRSYPVRQGDLVFIRPNELHKTLQAGESAHDRLLLHFDDRLIESAYGEHTDLLLSPFRQDSHVLRLPKSEQAAVDGLISRMLAELQQRSDGFELVLTHSVADLLLTAGRYLRHHQPLPFQHASPIHGKISDIVRYINDHYAEPMPLNDLAERFFISPHYLSRIFKEVTGFAFTDYLNHTRVKEAQRLLRESDRGITEIAALAGFENFSHFGKMFKKIARVSPRAYRKSLSVP